MHTQGLRQVPVMSRHVTGVIWETASMESCELIFEKTDNKREEQSWDEKAVI